MRRSRALFPLLSLAMPMALAAQSSQFGVRGLGLPGREASARALGNAGALALFDGESSQNPAALWTLGTVTTTFTTSIGRRTSENPAGSAEARDQRFPQVAVGGPLPRSRVAVGISYGTYADRDFSLVSEGVASPRGVPVAYTDTLTALGGVNDIRLAGAWAPTDQVQVGVGVHFLTGSNRLSTRRAWADSSYIAEQQRAELAYEGYGLSAGVLLTPTRRVQLAGSIRWDGTLDVQRDSTATVGSVDLPITLSAGARFRIHDRLELAGQASTRDWSVANDGLTALGAIGARNTYEFAGGLEWLRNRRRSAHLPLRVGVRYAQLPYLLVQGQQPTELGVALGTGVRFAGDRGGIDLSVERIRREQGSNYRENAWVFSVGMSVRAGGFGM